MALRRITVILSFFPLLMGFYSCSESDRKVRVLVFSKTEGFRHKSIPEGIEAIRKLGLENNFRVDTTEDASKFNEDTLRLYSAVIFLNTSGDVLDYRQQSDFERYIQAGGGFVGIHGAAATEYDWPWYGQLVGAWFDGHPKPQDAMITFLDHAHPSMNPFPEELPENNQQWKRFDEWYNFKAIQNKINVLAKLDESTYEGGKHKNGHPIIWYREYDGGRTFYTGLGHTAEGYEEPLFFKHLLGGIRYAIGDNDNLDYSKASTKRVPEDNRFLKMVLDQNLDEPMELAVTPEGKVFFVERPGSIKMYDPEKKATKLAGKLDVYKSDNDGLLGITLDPDFKNNGWIYLFYSPAGDIPKQHLSRFFMAGDSLVLSSEKILLEIPVQRNCCSHSAGSMVFGPDGHLFIATGDNTKPIDKYAAIDEREGRLTFDAQRSAANTNDLRGKILRIHPEPDGSYTIPEGNLFSEKDFRGRPEIYTMGHRNPFRITIDPNTKYLYWGDMGPDAGEDSISRGPMGYDEINQARKPGNYGWPYFIGREFDFATNIAGSYFNPAHPVNHSPNNTGMKDLPSAEKAFIWYSYSLSEDFQIIGKGARSAMAGPVFYTDAYKRSDIKFPEYYDGKLFIYDWMRSWIMVVSMDESGKFLSMEPFLPDMNFDKPMDMHFGPDGALYMLEYGTFGYSQNEDARLIRIEYAAGNRKLVAKIAVNQNAGATPFTVQFSARESFDHDKGDQLSYEWYFTSIGEVQSEKAEPSFTFEKPGIYKARLKVTDREGATAIAEIEIRAGNDPPHVSLEIDGNQTFFRDNNTFGYEVKVRDKEDGSLENGGIAPGKVQVHFDYLAQSEDTALIAKGKPWAGASIQFLQGKKSIDNSDCGACHMPDQISMGPGYKQIAQRYQGDAEAIKYLTDKIIQGGSGNWGELMMSAHPQLSQDETAEMVKYILSLGEQEKIPESMPLKGSVTTSEHIGTNEEGTYLFSAFYTDKGSNKIGPLTGKEIVTLRHPRVQAESYDSYRNVNRHLGGGVKFVRAYHDAYISFQDIDLTEVNKLTYRQASNSVGGRIELHLDSLDGELVSVAELRNTGGWRNYENVETSVKERQGKHDLFFVFFNEKAKNQHLFSLDWIFFEKKTHKSRP